MAGKIHPLSVAVTPKELREIQKLHELGKKYWPASDTIKHDEEARRAEPTRWRHYFRHPYARLCTAYLVVFCNFLIFAEDPVSHSYTECTINIIGDIYTFICINWPSGSFVFLKLGCWLFAILVGLLVGKYIIHRWLFCEKLKLKIFTEDGQGSWMSMFMTALMSLYIFSFAYNGFLMLEGKYMDKLHASPRMRMQNQTFMKLAALGTWLGDFFTAWMVTDMMLQGAKYPHWASGLRKIWKKGLNRVYAFWFVAVAMSVVVITGITTDFVDWDKMNRNFVSSNEIARAFMASFILVMDVLIVLQDWEFPHFAGSLDIKLPGLNTDSLNFRIPSCCGREPFEVYITGKWFNYGIIFIVMILDLNMWKNQIFYTPHEYGQYTDAAGFIYTVADKQFLRWADRSMMTHEWRWSHVNPKTNMTYGIEDFQMNGKYKGYSLTLKGLAFIPCLSAFCLFGYLLWVFGQEENPDDALVRKYRCDVRRRRQLARVRKNQRLKARRRVAALQAASLQAAGLLNAQILEANDKDLPSVLPTSQPLGNIPRRGIQGDPTRSAVNETRLGASNHETILNITLDEEAEGNPTSEEPAEKPVKARNSFVYYFRHPYSRICTSYLIVFCNFLIFAEDPVSHSYSDCIISIIGNMYSFVFSRYPPHAGYVALKIFMFTSAALAGMLVGKYFLHKFMLCRVFKLKMFSEEGQGSWMVMFMTVLLFLFMWSFVYSEFLLLAGPEYDFYVASSNMGIENQTFMKLAAMGTWIGDFLTAWMVTDMMLQEEKYPQWSPGLRRFWRRGLNRVYAFWFISFSMTVVVATAVKTDYLDWDQISRDFMPTNELSRAFLASFILVMDLLIVMQDWEFPHFADGMDIKLPGVNTADIKFHLPGGDIHISGKWFNYGIIFIVMILDLNMWKNQIYYEPFVYGQYVDESGYIYTVSEREFITNATTTTLSYAWRWNHTNPLTNQTYGAQDHKMNSKFVGFPFEVKGIAFFPSIFAFAMFGILAKVFSNEKRITKIQPRHGEASNNDIMAPENIPQQNVEARDIVPSELQENDATSRTDGLTDIGSELEMGRLDVLDFQDSVDDDLAHGRSEDGRSNDGRSNDGRSNDGRSNDGRSNDRRSEASTRPSSDDKQSSSRSLLRNSRSSSLLPSEDIELGQVVGSSCRSFQSRQGTRDDDNSSETFPRDNRIAVAAPDTVPVPASNPAAPSDEDLDSGLTIKKQAWEAQSDS